MMLMGGSGVAPTAQLLLADEDQSLVSSLVVNFFSQEQVSQFIQLEAVEREEGKARIADGDGSALLIIPEGFADAVINETKTELLLLTNPSQQILPAMIEETTSLLVDGAFYIQRVFGDELQVITTFLAPDGGEGVSPQDAEISDLAVGINQKMARLLQYIFPPLLEVQVTTAEGDVDPQSTDFALLFFPGILLMALVWTAQGLSDDLWTERELGTLRRLISSPRPVFSFVIGKIFGSAILLAGVLIIVLLIGFLYFGLPVIKLPIALIWLVLGGLIFFALMGLVQLVSPTHRAGTLITSVATFPLLMIGGSFFPFETMPGWMAAIGQWTPNGLILEILKNYFLDRLELMAFLQGFVVLLLSAAVLLSLVAWRSKSFARGT